MRRNHISFVFKHWYRILYMLSKYVFKCQKLRQEKKYSLKLLICVWRGDGVFTWYCCTTKHLHTQFGFSIQTTFLNKEHKLYVFFNTIACLYHDHISNIFIIPKVIIWSIQVPRQSFDIVFFLCGPFLWSPS